MMERAPAYSNQLGARITLLALEAAATAPSDGPLFYQFGRDGPPLDRNEMTDRLAELEKPLICAARIEDQTLVIDCRSAVTPGDSVNHQANLATWSHLSLRNLMARYSGQRIVLLRTPREVVLLSPEELQEWQREYNLDATYSFSRPDADARALGAVEVVTVLPPPTDLQVIRIR